MKSEPFLSDAAKSILGTLTRTCARTAPQIQISVADDLSTGDVTVVLRVRDVTKVLSVNPRLVAAFVPGCMDHVWEAVDSMPSGLQTVREP